MRGIDTLLALEQMRHHESRTRTLRSSERSHKLVSRHVEFTDNIVHTRNGPTAALKDSEVAV
jgi:hypothetical protein